MGRSDVYVTHTPLHLLLARLSILWNNNDTTLVIVIGDYPDARQLCESMAKSSGVPHFFIPGRASARTQVGRRLTVRRNSRRIRSLFKANPARNLFVFNSERAEDQLLLALNQDREEGQSFLLQDGSSALAEPAARIEPPLRHESPGRPERVKRAPGVRSVLGRIWYGSWWHNIQRFADHPLVRDMTTPGSGEPTLRDLNELRTDRPAMEALRAVYDQPGGLPPRSVVILLPPWEAVREDSNYSVRLAGCYQEIVRTHPSAMVKPHPSPVGSRRETRWLARNGVEPLGGRGPAEALFLQDGPQVSAVVGDLSTALLSARVLLEPSVAVISVARITGSYRVHPGLVGSFRAAGVLTPESMEQLQAVLR